MNDKPVSPGGSAWEPGVKPDAQPTSGQPAGEPDERSFEPSPEPRIRRFSFRGRGARVALASGIVALSGLGGFALGAAVADGDDELRPLGNRAEDGAVPRGPRGFADGRSGPPHGHGFDHDFDRGTPPDGDDPSTARNTDSGSDDADAGSLT